MKLTVLGCAGSFPGPESACSAYLVEADGFRLMLDFGTGSLSALQRYAGLGDIDAVLLSHLHCDHMLDACSYVVVRRYSPTGPYPRLPLFAPKGAQARMVAAYGMPNESASLEDVYDFHDLAPGTFPVGPLTVTVAQVEHPVETYGVRIEHAGRTLAYSADTAPCDALLDLAKDCEVFLCEASYLDSQDNPPGLHLTGRDAGLAATAAGAKRLLLTHLVTAWGSEAATFDAASDAFTGPIEVVRPGATYDV